MAKRMEIAVYWDCDGVPPGDGYQRFGGRCYPQLPSIKATRCHMPEDDKFKRITMFKIRCQHVQQKVIRPCDSCKYLIMKQGLHNERIE